MNHSKNSNHCGDALIIKDHPTPAGRVLFGSGETAYCATPSGPRRVLIPGKFLYQNSPETLPVTGDLIEYTDLEDGESVVLTSILPRKTVLERRKASSTNQRVLLCSNVDHLLIVTGLDQDFSANRILRFTILARNGGIHPIILLNKRDLVKDPEPFLQKVQALILDSTILAIDARSSSDVARVQDLIEPGSISAVIGSSGAGKSTLLNSLCGEDRMKTSPVRDKDSKGKHTTTHREIFCDSRGRLFIDQPGLREAGLTDDQEGLEESFSDLSSLASRCQFRDCTHTDEPGCSIRAALENGEISKERYRQYRLLLQETGEFQKAQRGKKRWKQINKEMKRYQKYHDKRRPLND